MDVSLAYDQTTSEINKIIEEDVIPKQLTPSSQRFSYVSESSSGYVWGLTMSQVLLVCESPCNDNWTRVPYPEEDIYQIHKIAADESNIYLLASTPDGEKVFFKPVNNKVQNWQSIVAPNTSFDLFVTSNYLWVNMADNAKQSCSKPCLEGNWKENTDDIGKITSSSGNILYGVDDKGNALRTDEGMKTGWSSISGFFGKAVRSVIGGDTQLLAFGEGGSIYKCDKDCATATSSKEMDRQGQEFISASIAPVKNSTWFLGWFGSGTYNQKDTSDPTYIKGKIDPIDDKRDSLLDRVKDFYNEQTDVLISNELLGRLSTYLKQTLNMNKIETSKQTSDLKAIDKTVKENNLKLNKINEMKNVIQILIFVLSVVCLMYLILSWVGSIVNYIAFAIIVAGLIFSIYLRKQ